MKALSSSPLFGDSAHVDSDASPSEEDGASKSLRESATQIRGITVELNKLPFFPSSLGGSAPDRPRSLDDVHESVVSEDV